MNNNQENRTQNASRPPMTPEQRRAYELKKHAYMLKKRQEEEKRRLQARHKLALAIIFTITITLVLGCVAIGLSAYLSKADAAKYETYTYRIGETRDQVAYRDIMRGSIVCIDVRRVGEVLGLTESSSTVGVITFTAKNSSQAVFTDGSSIVSVNGQNVQMPSTAIVDRDVCSVPLETVSYIFTGVEVEIYKSSIYITPTEDSVNILAKSNDPLNMIIEFKSNLKEYEDYMNPKGESRDKYLLLVNKENPLGESYKPKDLVALGTEYCINTNANMMNECAAKAFEALLTELWAATGDTSIIGTSAYRSYVRQTELFNGYIAEEKINNPTLSDDQIKQLVLSYSAYPGTSEHQSGLCIDLVDTERGKLENYADTGCFTNTITYNWLKNNAWKFGFVLRYPSDKESVTGYSYESWHFRFVGRYHAEKMYCSGQTLDEYVASLN